VDQLDTPALVVDLAVLEQNLETLHAFFRPRQAKVRPHVEAHRCPAIAHKQLAAGGTVGGICVTTLGQAEVFAAHGFTDIFVANVLVTPQKIGRLCGLARHVKTTVAIEHAENARDLSEAASMHGVTLHVVVDVNTRLNRCGVAPGRPAVDLARLVHKAPHLEFAGLMTHEGPMPSEDLQEMAAASRQWIQQVLDTREMLERAGMDVGMVSVGGTYNYEIAGTMAGITEVLAGSYAFMDSRHRPYRHQFKPAARVMSTVTSCPEPGTVITDAGQKAIGSDTGLPVAEDLPDATVVGLSAEHCRIRLPGAAYDKLALCDKVWLTPWDIGTCVNLYDYIHAVRHGKLEVVWEVAARGRYR
jgi:3-hydroxy-D-aspartate aldolase